MSKLITRSLPALAVVAIAVLSLVQLASARVEQPAASKTIRVNGGEFFFRLSTKTIARPGRVTFVFKNIGHIQHDFSIRGKRTPLIGPAKTARLVITFKKKGKYPFLCTVPGHAAAGMKGVFTVR